MLPKQSDGTMLSSTDSAPHTENIVLLKGISARCWDISGFPAKETGLNSFSIIIGPWKSAIAPDRGSNECGLALRTKLTVQVRGFWANGADQTDAYQKSWCFEVFESVKHSPHSVPCAIMRRKKSTEV